MIDGLLQVTIDKFFHHMLEANVDNEVEKEAAVDVDMEDSLK